MNRRSFVSTLATAGAVAATSPRLFGASSMKPPSVGLIGSGWFGGVNLNSLLRDAGVEAVSLCDVNTDHLTKTLELVAGYQDRVPETYTDYRKMLAARHHDIVIIATPDHWHALPAIEAMQAGADLFLEKPIGVDVMEGEAMLAAARKYDRVVQVNTQRRSFPIFGMARDKFIKSGRLGKIGLVETYCYLGMGRGGVLEPEPAPASLDYDRWTGPAPMLPFKPGKEAGRWRRYMAYGNGIVGDMAVHKVDVARWMLGLGWPTRISSTAAPTVETDSDATISDNQMCTFEYPELKMTWEHRTWGASPIKGNHWSDQWGVRFIGTEGTLNVTMLAYTFTPKGDGPVEAYHELSPDGDPANADIAGGHGDLTRRAEKAHAEDFMTARETRGRPIADIEEAHISSASCILANLAQDLGRPLSYDPLTQTIPGDPETTARLARGYRGPWVHPDPTAV